MKLRNKFLLTLGFSALMGFQSCVNSDINVDPNNPAEVSVDLLLPSAQLGTYFVYGNDNARTTSMLMQQSAGTDRQYIAIDRYSITEADVDNTWVNAYANALQDYKLIIDQSTAQGYNHYAGIAKIMTAATLGVVTDLWGDIPYSNALQGLDNLTPTFDSQEAIYNTIFELLTTGVEDLSKEAGAVTPGNDDMIFNGDLAAWTKAANALKARYHLHLSGRDDSHYGNALTALDSGFESSADDANAQFASVLSNSNFWYLFNTIERGGYLSASSTLIGLMESIDDPRMASYFTLDSEDGFSGSGPGEARSPSLNSTTGPAFASDNSPISLVSFVEQKFIEAEAALATGDAARAAEAHNAAVTASVEMYGNGDGNADFLAAEAVEDAGSITLEKIMTHKYIALYTQVEVYNDWRRTGIPSLDIAVDASLNSIPVRMPYPQSERLYNGENLPSANLTDKVWWDVD